MTHADAFLQDILAHPDDDAPRLIFADWLEEQGDANSTARAEFIRIQCALAAGKQPKQQQAELERRQQQILDEWGKVWVRPLRRLVATWGYHRGLIDNVTMWCDTFLTHASRLFRLAPIQHLRLLLRAPQSFSMAVFAENEQLCHLRSLNLSGNRLDSQSVRNLMVSPYLTGLTSLNLAWNQIGESGIRALAEAPLLAQLRQLDLYGNVIGPSGLRVLAESLERLARASEGLHLQMLDMRNNKLGRGAKRRLLAEWPLLRQLVRI